MSIPTTREQPRQLARDNAKLPKHLTLIAPADWPQAVLSLERPPVAVWRSRSYLVVLAIADLCEIAAELATTRGRRRARLLRHFSLNRRVP